MRFDEPQIECNPEPAREGFDDHSLRGGRQTAREMVLEGMVQKMAAANKLEPFAWQCIQI